MRIKINTSLTVRAQGSPNNLYRRFHRQLDTLLAQVTPSATGSGRGGYVPNEGVERSLDELRAHTSATCAFFVGSKGIGKSTYIQHCFGVNQNPALNDGVLVIPFHLDGLKLEEADAVSRLIIGKIQAAVAASTDLAAHPITPDALGAFIQTHRSDLLQRDLEMPDDAPLALRIAHLRRTEPYAYVAERLKYVAHTSGLRKVIILVDDVESCSYAMQKSLVRDLLKFQVCLSNVRDDSHSFETLVLVSCRPITERLLKREPDITAFPLGHTYTIERPVALGELFQARFETAHSAILSATRADGAGPIDSSALAEAKTRLDEICRRLSSNKGDTILRLMNHNFRDAMKEFVQILINSRWFEVDPGKGGSFKIEESNYRTTDASILRAIGLRSANVFDGESSPIVNLFYNRADPDADLVLMHIAKYLLFYRSFADDRLNIVRADTLKRDLTTVFAGADDRAIGDLLDFAKRTRLVDEDVRDEGGSPVSYLTETPRLAELWTLLGGGSVYLELCCDDTYLPGGIVVRRGSLPVSTSLLGDPQVFHTLFDVWWEVARREMDVMQSCFNRNEMATYRRYFGTVSIAKHCLAGVSRSLKAYYRDRIPETLLAREKEAAAQCIPIIEMLMGTSDAHGGNPEPVPLD